MNILRPRADLPGTSHTERYERSGQRVSTLMIFIYAFCAILCTAFGAFANGCRMEEAERAPHIGE